MAPLLGSGTPQVSRGRCERLGTFPTWGDKEVCVTWALSQEVNVQLTPCSPPWRLWDDPSCILDLGLSWHRRNWPK